MQLNTTNYTNINKNSVQLLDEDSFKKKNELNLFTTNETLKTTPIKIDNDPVRLFNYFYELAHTGDPKAMKFLANYYAVGVGEDLSYKDFKKAFDWYQKSAALGIDAQRELRVLFVNEGTRLIHYIKKNYTVHYQKSSELKIKSTSTQNILPKNFSFNNSLDNDDNPIDPITLNTINHNEKVCIVEQNHIYYLYEITSIVKLYKNMTRIFNPTTMGTLVLKKPLEITN